jgi:monoamine oxidase
MRVVVVGAGLAGLSAAERLLSAGADVTLIEAGQRVGGRARTVRQFHGRQVAESGAEWVDTDHRRMLRLVDRFGLQLEGQGQIWTLLRRYLYRDGRLLAAADLDALEPALRRQLDEYQARFEAFAEGIVDPSRPQDHPEAAQIDASSMADVAEQCGLGEVARLFSQRNAQGEFADEPRAISALFVAQQRALMANADHEVRSHRLVGGMSQIAERWADTLPVGVLRRGEPVTAIEWTADGAEVRTSTSTVPCDRVVVACALPALRRIELQPALPPALAEAIEQLGYGTVTKTALQFPRRTWPAGYANNDLASQRVYEATLDQPGESGILMAYTGGDGGRSLAEADEEQRRRAIADDMHRMYLTGAPIAGFSRAWSTHERFGGSYAAYRPGQVCAYWDVLRQPCGPLRLAGEHVATCTGYLEGAVESGETVAEWALRSQ